ncbi:MAG: protein GlmU [Desulfobacter sp.]
MIQKRVTQLVEKGVNIPNPATVYISEDVDLNRISGNGVTLYNGTKLVGRRTLIADNVRIGYEAPVTLENTLVGPGSNLNGGFFQDAVFVRGNTFGSGAHVRKGTILEEQANAAHTVGLKQTILFPFVTLGSLINFCDCFMAGGTSRKDHSEVGSSFIHFNYTPNQDKATPSMMGNVHQGVMLDQRPVFLGGQGGLVGPVKIGFGCTTAAGSVVRTSEERPDRLILGGGFKNTTLPLQPGVYTRPENIFTRNADYIAGLLALRAWYQHVRPLFIHDFYSEELVRGLQKNLSDGIDERVNRLFAFADKLKVSREILSGKTKAKPSAVLDSHDKVLAVCSRAGDLIEAQRSADPLTIEGERFIKIVASCAAATSHDYLSTIQGLDRDAIETGISWLMEIQSNLLDNLSL